jgi:hypothetical protein
MSPDAHCEYQDPPISEVRVFGGAAALRTISRSISERTGLRFSQDGPHRTGARVIDRLTIVTLESQRLVANVEVSHRVLQFAGDDRWLRLVAENLVDLAVHGVPGDHWHMEFVPGHPFLSETSRSVVFDLVEEGV